MQTLTTQIEAETNILLEELKLNVLSSRAKITSQAIALNNRNPFIAKECLDIIDDLNKTLKSIKDVENRIAVFGVK